MAQAGWFGIEGSGLRYARTMDIAERYVRLAHGINALQDGFIDSYIGPPAWADNVMTDLSKLEADRERLAEDIAALDDVSRREFLTSQTQAMRTMLRLIRGEKLSYGDEVEGLHDIHPEFVPQASLESALVRLEAVLPGSGDVSKRWRAMRERFRVAPERIEAVVTEINRELQARSKRLFALPEHESIHFEMVNDKPWSGYNWYLGDATSRVDINTDLPSYLCSLPDLVAHEGYPGHHTERVFKDALYRDGQGEFSLQLLNAPEAVLAEGIATNALEFIVSDHELPVWVCELAPTAGLNLTLEDCREMFMAMEAYAALDGVRGNVALMVHRDGVSDQVALEYLQRFMLADLSRAQKSLEFIKHPNSRAYVYTYTVGYRLVRAALDRAELDRAELDRAELDRHAREKVYRKLLAEPVTPGQLRLMHGGST
jgi:hypothetical protein